MANTGKIIPFTVTGGVSSNTNIQTLSGFTNSLTTFKFVLSSIYTSPDESTQRDAIPEYISNDKLVWNFGDGTHATGLSAEHIYTVPGKYVVSLIAYSSAGDQYLSTHTESLSVSNWFADGLFYDNSNTVFNIRNVIAGRPEDKTPPPILIERMNSWQSYPALSAHNKFYTLNAYVSGSRARKLDVNQHNTSKWAHISDTWSFYEKLTADNKMVYYNPVDTVDTTTEEIYFHKRHIYDYDSNSYLERYVRVPLSKVLARSPEASGSVLVATSGVGELYYADDMPSTGANTALVNISLNTDHFRDTSSVTTDDRASYDRLNPLEQSNVKIPIRVKRAGPETLEFTSSSIRTMKLSNNKWQMTKIPFFINVADGDGTFQKDRPPLSINPHPLPATTDTHVINLSVVSNSGAPLSAHFFRTVDTQLPTSLSGAYRGFFIPRDAGDNAQLVGTGQIESKTTYTKDTNILWVGNTQLEKIYRLIPSYIKHTTDDKSGSMEISVTTQSEYPYDADTFPIATVPLYDELSRDHTITHIADTSTDRLSSFDTYGNMISSINFEEVYVQSLSGVKNLLHLNAPFAEHGSPSCIAVDKNRDFWVSLNDAASVHKFSNDTGFVISSIANEDNVTYESAITGLQDFLLSGYGGINLYEPGIVDVDKENNVWVAYTGILKSMIRKYTTDGEIIATYEFPQGVIPHDMVVDNKSNIWVSTINIQRTPRETIETQVAAYVRDDGNFAYYTGVSTSNYNPDLTDWQVGEIFESQWNVHDKHFNGKFLITEANYNPDDKQWTIDVTPYTARHNQMFLLGEASSQAVSATQISVYPSDKVYKFDSSGTKVLEVSGFYNPAHMIVDGYQRPWIIHDTNTLQQLDATTGATLQRVRVESTEFLANSAAKFHLAAFADTQLKGVTCDTFDNVTVINAFENNIFTINTETPNISSFMAIDVNPDINSMMYRSFGDWSGFRWINKYQNVQGIHSLSGTATLNIFPSGGKYKIAKFNEDFDPSETIKSYRFQQLLLDDDTFFDDFYGSIVGTVSSEPTCLGKAIYEKIANFTGNNVDPETCNINTLYSLCEQTGTDIDNYNFTYPGNLRRIVDLVSVSHKRLYGERSKFSRDFDKSGTTSVDIGVNLGSKLDTSTYIVTAGIPIVAEQLFNREYSVINPMYISSESSDPGYDSKAGMLSSYPLRDYSTSWRWGLKTGSDDTEVSKFYNFYTYNVKYNNIQLEGLIDWDNPYTNISHTLSSIDTWYDKDGLVDTMIDYELRRGLGLIIPTLSATSADVQ